MLLDKLQRQGDALVVDEHPALMKQLLVADFGFDELLSYRLTVAAVTFRIEN